MTLNWNLTTKNMHPHGLLKQKLAQKIGKLETHLEHFPADAVHLLVSLERHPKKPWFGASLTLHVPSNTLRADSEADTDDALLRCVWGVLGRMTSDAFAEFWPDVKRKVFKK